MFKCLKNNKKNSLKDEETLHGNIINPHIDIVAN